MKKISYRKIIVSFSTAAAISIIAPLAVSCSKDVQNTAVTTRNSSDSSKLPLEAFWNNNRLFWDFFGSDQYPDIEKRAAASKPYLDFIQWLSVQPKGLYTPKEEVFAKIDSLDLAYELKVYLLQNLIDKIKTREQMGSGIPSRLFSFKSFL